MAGNTVIDSKTKRVIIRFEGEVEELDLRVTDDLRSVAKYLVAKLKDIEGVEVETFDKEKEPRGRKL